MTAELKRGFHTLNFHKMTSRKNDFKHAQGHWILARMGKKVLRPGGKELTMQMMDALSISPSDHVVEFAPGTGFTAGMTLSKHPASYTGVELDQTAANRLKKLIEGNGHQIVVANAAESTLESECADKVYGEAMLTMHVDKRKSMIIREAHRLLKSGGLYGIHELCLQPDGMDEASKAEVQRTLAQVIRVNARPQTTGEWKALLENEGFEVLHTFHNPMHLLEKKRMIDDEGLFGALKIGFNLATHPEARKRIVAMRAVFHRYRDHLSAISIVARKR